MSSINPTKAVTVARQRAAMAPANSRERFVRLLALAALELSGGPALSSSARRRLGTSTNSGAGGESTGSTPGEPVRVPARRVIKSIPQ